MRHADYFGGNFRGPRFYRSLGVDREPLGGALPTAPLLELGGTFHPVWYSNGPSFFPVGLPVWDLKKRVKD
jgi:hypothetical protein